MKRHKIYNKRAEDLMKRLFEKQGISQVDIAAKEAQVEEVEVAETNPAKELEGQSLAEVRMSEVKLVALKKKKPSIRIAGL